MEVCGYVNGGIVCLRSLARNPTTPERCERRSRPPATHHNITQRIKARGEVAGGTGDQTPGRGGVTRSSFNMDGVWLRKGKCRTSPPPPSFLLSAVHPPGPSSERTWTCQPAPPPRSGLEFEDQHVGVSSTLCGEFLLLSASFRDASGCCYCTIYSRIRHPL